MILDINILMKLVCQIDKNKPKIEELEENFDAKPAFLKEFNETLTAPYAKIVELKLNK